MNASDVVWGAEKDEARPNVTDSLVIDHKSMQIPKSRCSEPCGVGAVKKMTEVCDKTAISKDGFWS